MAKRIVSPKKSTPRIMHFIRGPYDGETANLSGYAPQQTLTFTARGRTGFYIRTTPDAMEWRQTFKDGTLTL